MITLLRPPATAVPRFSTTSTNPLIGLAYLAGALGAPHYEAEIADAVDEDPQSHKIKLPLNVEFRI